VTSPVAPVASASRVEGLASAGPGGASKRGPSRRAPWWLWVAAGLVLVPITLPVAALIVRVVGASEQALSILFDARTLELLVRSTLLTTLVTAAAIVIGVGAAWITVRTDLRGRSVWGVLVALPLVIPSYVIALSFLSATGPRGLVARVTGAELPVLDGLAGAWLALTLSTFPYVFLIVAAALRRIDPALEDAARGLGAPPFRVFRTVTLPQLRPAIGAGALLVALYTLSDFGAVSLMRFDAFTRVIYAQYAGRLDRTAAAVLSVALIVIALVIIWGEERTRGSATFFSNRPNRKATPRHLGLSGRVSATAALSFIVIAGLVLPVAVLVSWVVEGSRLGAGVSVDWAAVGGSLLGSSLAAVAAVAAAIPIVVLAVRYRSRVSRWLERSVFVAFSLPHITVAIAVVFFSVRYLGPLYQSLAVLVVVYASVFLAQATGSAKASMLQVDPAVEEASRGLGRGPWATLRSITIPLIRPGLLAGGALVFLTTMKELPATLLLRPTGFDTLAVDIWSAANELLYAQAAASALVLLAISAVPMYVLVLRQKDGAL
jgi:iron(III) transport system permease protein